MRLHYLQHVPFENPGSILTWANENGHVLSNTKLFEKEELPKQEDFDWLVIMGGPMNIYEEEQYPWLVKEKLFIKEAIVGDKVVIGLCLGAQLIADVLGGKVTRNPVKEIGWFPIEFTEKARLSPLFSFFPKDPIVFEWHGDTFSTLPEEVTCIAQNKACKHQAFQYKNKVFGFQFHMENTLSIIEGLVNNCRGDMTPGEYVQTAEELQAHPEYIKQDNEWMTEFLSQLMKYSANEEIVDQID